MPMPWARNVHLVLAIPEVVLSEPRIFRKLLRVHEQVRAVRSRQYLVEDLVVDVSADLIRSDKFVRHVAYGVHTGLVHVVAVVADAEVDEDRLALAHPFHARPDRKSGREPQPAHGGIGLAHDAAGPAAQDVPRVRLVIERRVRSSPS